MASTEPWLSIILPTYNERESVGTLVRVLDQQLADVPHEILVMDDRSPDGTAEVARAVAREYPSVRVFERQPPHGLAVSLWDGVCQARGKYVVWMDCDMTLPPELLPHLWAPLESGEADLSCASRYVPGGADLRESALIRLFSRIITGLSRRLIHPGVLDYTSGYVMGRRELVLELGIHGYHGEYCIELLGTAVLRGLRVLEIPFQFGERQAGASKTFSSWWSFANYGRYYLKTLASMWWRKRRLARMGRPAAAPAGEVS